MAVFSDTHGKLQGLAQARQRLGSIDVLLHAGDHHDDAPLVATGLGIEPVQVHAVIGNCDFGQTGPEECLLELAGVRILLIHGHRHDVKRTLQRVFYRAHEQSAQIAIFGHTHVPLHLSERGILLFNPGSYSEPRVMGPGTYGLLTISERRVQAEHITAVCGF